MIKRIILVFVILLLVSCNSSEKKTVIAEIKISEEKIDMQKSTKLLVSMNQGKEIYTVFCVSCHLPNGKGVEKTFPPLAKSDYLMNKRDLSIKAIKFGQNGKIVVNGITYNNVMAPLGLTDQEIADVMNYITTSWDNTNKKMITKAEVSEIEQ